MIRIYKNLSTKFSNLVNNSKITTPKKNIHDKHRPSAFYNRCCRLCDEPTQNHPFFCDECYFDLPRSQVKCIQCCLPLTLEQTQADSVSLVCGECLSLPPSFSKTLCPFQYEFPIKEIIRKIKYSKQRFWIKTLCWSLCQEYFRKSKYHSFSNPDLLIPIPIHTSKRKMRGFNQAELIAKALSKNTGIPISTKILIKIQNTDTQAELNKSERMKNLKGSFRVSKKAASQNALTGKHVALIDDVMTTKATCELASKLLLEGGAKQVDVWCLARTAKNR